MPISHTNIAKQLNLDVDFVKETSRLPEWKVLRALHPERTPLQAWYAWAKENKLGAYALGYIHPQPPKNLLAAYRTIERYEREEDARVEAIERAAANKRMDKVLDARIPRVIATPESWLDYAKTHGFSLIDLGMPEDFNLGDIGMPGIGKAKGLKKIIKRMKKERKEEKRALKKAKKRNR